LLQRELIREGIVICAYIEVLDVGENLIVESEVIGWDDVDTSILLDLPMCETETLGLGQKLLLGDLASPVVLGGLLQVTVHAHAGKTEDRSDLSLAVGLDVNSRQVG
jgi:hypothetical protein